MKLDVEGAEEQVIAGAPNLFYNIRPIWFVELVQGVQIILADQQKRFLTSLRLVTRHLSSTLTMNGTASIN